MHNEINQKLKQANNLQAIEEIILALLEEYRIQHLRIGYVSGVITSDGPAQVEANLEKIRYHANLLRSKNDFPIFAPTDIFTPQIYQQIKVHTIPDSHFKQFWRNILNAGYVTDIFMTPRWEVSGGARDEHQTAKKLKIQIHYIEN